ncbi:DUF368 domain-containing protein [Bacillus alkalicellulosilyticus]|uniref:DUF368 domain-containing protein n=1 Tax=Alkalihalobacterium alkalicellulosilyticum TaxID=1912214 RepID=UPI000997B7E0|nr:DUF368 domain-containing protein [Bacillus alkalicellulosilyticus]
MIEWKNLFRGMMMGISDLVPGISGGTIAVVLGIYDRFISSISKFFSREWKAQLGFLVPLGTGMVGAIFLLAHLITWLLSTYAQPTYFFFLGLIAGILPYLLRKVDYKKTFTPIHYLVLVIAAISLGSTIFIGEGNNVSFEVVSFMDAIYLFVSAFFGSMAMLLPGISGSFVLLTFGTYEFVMEAIKSMNIAMILLVGSGIALGFIVSSKVIGMLLKKLPIMTYAFIIGIVIGSMVVIFPGIEQSIGLLLVSIFTFVVGFYIAVYLGRLEHK